MKKEISTNSKDTRLTYNINENENNMKLKEYLKQKLNFSTRFTRAVALSGRVTVNNKVVTLRYVLKSGDILQVEVSKKESQNIEPQKMDLDIVYEDSDVIVVNKSPGMVVHPTRSYPLGTLSNGLLYYFREKGENCIVRLVSRLDMDTSGLILVAKNQFSHMSLARDMHSSTFKKSYMAIVHGHIADTEGTLDFPIYKPEDEGSIKRIVDVKGQKSITHYKVIEQYNNSTLLRLTLETGRTHQIRVHLSHIGNPIYGDTLYGVEDDSDYISRQALHAYKISFPQPRTGEVIELETNLPDDMNKLVKILKKNG